MAPLSSDEALRVLETCNQLLRERARFAGVLADLPGIVGQCPQGAQRARSDRWVTAALGGVAWLTS